MGRANAKRQKPVACGSNDDSRRPIGAKPIATAPAAIITGPTQAGAGDSVAVGVFKLAIRCGREYRRVIGPMRAS
jgi:hypothetical protein